MEFVMNDNGKGQPERLVKTKRMRGSRHGGPLVGMLEWFRPGDHDRVDAVLDDLKALGVTELRTVISWADCCMPEGEAWYAWLFPQIAPRVHVLPCFVDTPPFWDIAPKTSAPPGNLKSYADFLDVLITRFGKYFEWIDLWNEPNDPRKWDAELDPYWIKFSEMIGNAAYWAQHRGKKTVLGGMRPGALGTTARPIHGARRHDPHRSSLAETDGPIWHSAIHRCGGRAWLSRHVVSRPSQLGMARPLERLAG
jgi:hypothetical protein